MATPGDPQPLSGVKVLDFSTLLPGPMAGLILAEAGAAIFIHGLASPRDGPCVCTAVHQWWTCTMLMMYMLQKCPYEGSNMMAHTIKCQGHP